MRAFLLAVLTLSFAACSTPQYAERMPIRPAPSMPLAPTAQQMAQPVAPSPAPQAAPLDDAATKAWLDQQIDQNRYVPPPPPPPPVQVVERVVERPVYVRERVAYESYPSYGYDGYYSYQPYYYGSYQRRSYHSTFPLNTALGAGVGAIIGHQSGHRGRGAWIGGGLGLLLDLNSRW
jgi:hypothetical protein